MNTINLLLLIVGGGIGFAILCVRLGFTLYQWLAPKSRPDAPLAAHFAVLAKAALWRFFVTLAVLSANTAPVEVLLASEPTIVERGPHHAVWQSLSQYESPNGTAYFRTNRYTALETGMHYIRDGRWAESKDEIELFQDGAIARQGQFQVIFAPNINGSGSTDLLAVDGKRFSSHIIGINLYDVASGRSVLIGSIKDSIGELLPPNQIIYRDAFSGVSADITYIVTKAGFEQNVIFRENPSAAPEQFGFDARNTLIEVITEFLAPPVPVKKTQTIASPDAAVPMLTDERLDFGAMQIGNGKAFALNDQLDPAASVPVSKNWVQADGRTFLIEAVSFACLRPQLQTLPPQQAAIGKKPGQFAVMNKRTFPPAGKATQSKSSMRMASLPAAQKGVMIDYDLSSATNMTFAGNETYWVAGPVNLSGTNFIEGGAVIKFNTNTTSRIKVLDTLICSTAPYRPGILTCRDDDTVGATIAASSGNPSGYYGEGALYFDAKPSDLKYLRFSFFPYAIYYNANLGSGNKLSHSQMVRCKTGIQPNNNTFSLQNVLMNDVLTNFFSSANYSATGRCEHLTINQSSQLNNTNLISLYLTNSLLVAITNTGAGYLTNSSSNIGTASDPSTVFQTVGAGKHYLIANSIYRNAGTTNISAALATDLRSKTTFPPVVMTNKISVNTTLSPQAQRDTDTPDLGYHYDPIDYALDLYTVTNAVLTITNGTAIASFGNYAIWLQDNSQLVSEGAPLNLNHFTRFYAVQEQATNWGNGHPSDGTTVNPYNFGQSLPSARFRFTSMEIPAGGGYHTYTWGDLGWGLANLSLKDCQVFGACLNLEGDGQGNYSFTNNLFERVTWMLIDNRQFDAYNNLFRNNDGMFWQITSNAPWTFKDNLLDSSTIINVNDELVRGYNAYYQSSDFYSYYATNGNEIVLTNLTYQSGFLGNYYQPTNSALINAGSRNATNAGLFTFTTTTNQVKELNSVVDIGLHYLALNGSNQPGDADGDGWSDYYEDANGNGSVDSGETDWQSYNSIFGIGSGPGLSVFTPLKP